MGQDMMNCCRHGVTIWMCDICPKISKAEADVLLAARTFRASVKKRETDGDISPMLRNLIKKVDVLNALDVVE